MYLTVVPAYGRDYKSKKEVLADWNAHKDFQICCLFHSENGRYINKDEIPKGTTINVRYDHQRKVLPILVK